MSLYITTNSILRLAKYIHLTKIKANTKFKSGFELDCFKNYIRTLLTQTESDFPWI